MERIQQVYFIGIGGIGMSALARYFNAKGKKVSGYDRTSSHLTQALEQEGITIHFADQPESLSEALFPKESTLVVFTPAVPESHQELIWFKNKEYQVVKRSQALGLLTANVPCIAIAGTHGKTTTSSLLAHIFEDSGHGCNAFLGGIASNYQTNLLLSDQTELCIVEADEYDRSFLTLHPQTAVITSTDSDHLDIYGSDAAFKSGFEAFANQVTEHLITHQDVSLNHKSAAQCETYGFDSQSPFRAENIHVENGTFVFDFVHPEGDITAIRTGLPGIHNVENAVAAIACALKYKLAPQAIKAAVESFKGVYRRFDRHIISGKTLYIDDYAHHPTELDACIKSVRMLYPERKVLGIFQPHLFSRTKDFGEAFAKSLSQLDEIILLDIYPARELPIPGIDSQWLIHKISHPHKKHLAKSEIFEGLEASHAEIVLTLGAGDIDRLVNPIKQYILERNQV